MRYHAASRCFSTAAWSARCNTTPVPCEALVPRRGVCRIRVGTTSGRYDRHDRSRRKTSGPLRKEWTLRPLQPARDGAQLLLRSAGTKPQPMRKTRHGASAPHRASRRTKPLRVTLELPDKSLSNRRKKQHLTARTNAYYCQITPQEPPNADINPVNYSQNRRQIRSYFALGLLDPEQSRFEVHPLRRSETTSPRRMPVRARTASGPGAPGCALPFRCLCASAAAPQLATILLRNRQSIALRIGLLPDAQPVSTEGGSGRASLLDIGRLCRNKEIFLIWEQCT